MPVEELSPVKQVWPEQPWLLQLPPPTVNDEFWLADPVVATVPVVVTWVVLGLLPVPVASSLYVGVMALLSFFDLHDKNTTEAMAITDNVEMRIFFILLNLILPNISH